MGLIGLCASLTSQVADSNSTTLKTILSLAIPANAVEAGSVFEINAAGGISTASSQQLGFGVAVNGTTIASISPGISTSGIAQGWYINGRLTVRSLGASGTVIAVLRGRLGTSSTSVYAIVVPTSPTAVDTSSPITLSIGMTWAAASSTNVATCDFASIMQMM